MNARVSLRFCVGCNTPLGYSHMIGCPYESTTEPQIAVGDSQTHDVRTEES